MAQITSAESICSAALEKASPQERAAYLDQACGNDIDLRSRVESLLEIANVREAAGPNAILDYQRPENPGTHIGPYKLLQEIGEGGMGIVYMADQEKPVRRRVALKIIKPGMDTGLVIARFEAERQALAMMDHQNIAHVLDAGTTESGKPYFVMELVHGVPFTKYCDDNHLTPRQRIELFVPVCHAVQHAHQKGIIHRDLKPSNVLVCLYDGQPVPKIIDFGVAKATEQRLTERTLFTQFGAIVGTVEYMSPEQAEISHLGVDTRSDIYSLGVMLFELLTGTTPLERRRLREAGHAEVMRLIREEEPPKPSTRLSRSGDSLARISAQRGTDPGKLTKLVRGELDWIVMKCLEKDRTRRYGTATALADDISHYLADEPVLACPPSAGYRLRKSLRRNKGPATAAALVLIVLIAGMIGTTLGLVQSRQEEAKAKASQEDALQKEAQARAAEADMRTVLEFFQGTVLAAARPKGQEGGLGIDATIRAAVDAAEPQIADKFRDKPLVEAAICQTLGRTYFHQGEYARASAQFERALQLRRANLGLQHPDTVQSMTSLGSAYVEAGRPNDALPLHELAVKLSKAMLGPEHQDTLSSRLYLAWAYRVAGHPENGVPLLEDTLKLSKAKLGAEHPQTLETMNTLALLYQAAGRFNEALPLYEETLRLRKAKLGPEHQDTLNTMGGLASGYQAAGRFKEALPLLEETLKLSKAKLGVEHPNTLESMRNLAWVLQAVGRVDDALPLLEEALKLSKAKLGDEHRYTLSTGIQLARAYQAVGRNNDALLLWEKNLPALRKATKANPTNAMVYSNLGNALLNLRELAEAEAAFHKAIELKPDLALAYSYLSVALRDQNKLAEAKAAYRKAIELQPHDADLHHKVSWLLSTSPDARFRDSALAVQLGKKAVELVPENGIFWTTLGVAQYRAGSQRDAIAALEKSMQLRNGGDAKAWFFLAMAHWQLGDKVQARKWYDQAARWTDKHQPQDEELSRFRSEAGELLEVGTKSGNRSTGSAGLGLALVAEYARVLNLTLTPSLNRGTKRFNLCVGFSQ